MHLLPVWILGKDKTSTHRPRFIPPAISCHGHMVTIVDRLKGTPWGRHVWNCHWGKTCLYHVYIMFIMFPVILQVLKNMCQNMDNPPKSGKNMKKIYSATRSALQIGFQLSRCHTRLFGAESRSTCFEDVWNFGQRHKRYEQLHIHTVMEAANGAMVCFFNKLTEDDTGKTFYVEQHSKTVWKRPCEWHFTKKLASSLHETWAKQPASVHRHPVASWFLLAVSGANTWGTLRQPTTERLNSSTSFHGVWIWIQSSLPKSSLNLASQDPAMPSCNLKHFCRCSALWRQLDEEIYSSASWPPHPARPWWRAYGQLRPLARKWVWYGWPKMSC